ncbi:MAG: hypothetical protein R2828_08085 [Saprospiraceae bacterium]
MSKKCVRLISTTTLNDPTWGAANHFATNQALLDIRQDQSFSHFLLRFDPLSKAIEAGIGLTVEHLPSPDETTITVLRLGIPFGQLNSLNLSLLFTHLIKKSIQFWRQQGLRPLYWWTAADHETYGLIARFSMRFYPSRKYLMLSRINWLQDSLGRKYFGDSYHAHTGTIAEPPVALSAWGLNGVRAQHEAAWLESISQTDWDHPDYGFYMDINRGVVKGNTLLVLMPFTVMNMVLISAKLVFFLLREKIRHKHHALRTALSNFFAGVWKNPSQMRRMLKED